MHQTDLVGGVQRLGDLLDDAHRPRGIDGAVGEHGLQVAALDQPHVHIRRPSISP
jgi:hypothetical protein